MSLKSAPQAPASPNPYVTANAQTSSNIQTGIANTVMGNANENSPYGSVAYQQTGTYSVQVPKLDSFGSPTGQFTTQEVPTFTRNVTLTPTQQQMLNQQNQMGIALNQTGLNQITKISDLLSTPVNAAALPARATSAPQAPQFQSLQNGPQYGSLSLNQSVSQPTMQSSLGLNRASGSFADVGGAQRSVNLGQESGTIAPTGAIQSGVNLQNAGTDFASAGQAQSQFGQTGNIQSQIDPNAFSQDRQTYEDAVMSRLNPQLQRDRDALENSLVNQGLARGSDAFNKSMDEYNRQANDARTQAVLAGGQEQSRMFNQALGAAQFGNSAQAQAYGQELGRGQFANAAQDQNFQQAQARGLFGLNALNQNNQNALTSAQFGNQAQAQQFGQNAQRADFANQAITANNQSAISAGNFANQAQNQDYTQALGRTQFANEAVGANNQYGLTEANFANQARQSQFDNALNAGTFANQAATQQQGFNNDLAQQSYTDYVNQTRYSNDTANTAFQNQINAANFQDSLRQQALQETLSLRNQPINEISALMSGGQVSMPQFSQFNPGQVANTPIGDYVYRTADLNNQQYQSQLQAQSAANGGLFGLASAGIFGAAKAGMFSDRRLKRDIVDTGLRLMNGLKVYLYRYAWEAATRVGLMADEVVQVHPDAVEFVGGYAAVDYRAATV